MAMQNVENLFTSEVIAELFPKERTDQFFEALFGDVNEGAYDIYLTFIKQEGDTLHFEFQLQQRPGKCLSCSLTYGLPRVFQRHPIINIKSLVARIENLLDSKARCADWELGRTRDDSPQRHAIPFRIFLDHH